MATAFFERLRKSAFDDLNIDGHVIDLQGWMCPNFEKVFAGHADAAGPAPLVIEVGTWKGKSAITMASARPDATIVTVDTWLGAPEFWTWGIDDPTRGASMGFENGFPRVFYTFTKNVKSCGLADRICPLPLSSVQAAEVLRFHGVRADIVYLDAAHEYEQVAADIEAYWPLLKAGGAMFGDDYSPEWAGVVRAVDEHAARLGLELKVEGVVWSLRKPV